MEASAGARYTTKCDIWALGIILYNIVYGYNPFNTVPGGKLSKIKAFSSLDIPVDFARPESLGKFSQKS